LPRSPAACRSSALVAAFPRVISRADQQVAAAATAVARRRQKRRAASHAIDCGGESSAVRRSRPDSARSFIAVPAVPARRRFAIAAGIGLSARAKK
jgi:hypothetical protein